MKPKVGVFFKMKSGPLNELKKHVQVVLIPYPNEEELKEVIRDLDGIIIAPVTRITREVLEEARRLKVISCQSAGYDHVDVEEATRRGVYVTKVSGLLSEAVAEFALGLLINLMRKIHYADRFIREGKWESHTQVWKSFKSVETLYGKKVGIVGMGAIGKAIARRLPVFGAKVYYWSRTRKKDIEREVGATYLDLDELLESVDIVVLALPLTKETYHIIDEERIRKLKGKYLVNIGRGALIDEKALVKAIKEGILKGFATDVFENEPVKEHELFRFEWETVLTPHYAGLANEVLEDMGFRAVENLLKVLRGEIPEDLVNKEVLKVRPITSVKML
ncbi:2-hydroxyacid dehydrogenase [Pyrococcus sp. NA2]|uniref:NAD(P)-dependent oxidoreductase n=1 Tax=Pyrococcus sp. (strain NA2) TaxID=342949 RepID=UPI000209AB6D|nr:NAD(P)-dependent oxidoreductase [Pyrococcus sp. NA2]AEC52065.1 2-hydroxyacid dehydrogenase [Pyrococcus sp. NA2]